MLGSLIEELRAGRHLRDEEVASAVNALTDAAVSPEEKADFLGALAVKGETEKEIAGFAMALRDRSVQIPNLEKFRMDGILDVCGTGGDQLHTFNISTTVSFVVAAGGVYVAKHGNRAMTSKCGAADVLEALGVRTQLEPGEVAEWLEAHRFAFLFAPRFHPAFQHIGPARKLCAQRGQRTLFNFLGPMLNPARPSAQLVGVAHPRFCPPLAQVLRSMGVARAMVISGAVPGETPAEVRYMDEWSLQGPTTVAESYQDRASTCATIELQELSLDRADLQSLSGGDKETNARIVKSVLDGSERGPKRTAVLVNAGAAFFVAGKTRSILEGMDMAAAIIDTGKAVAKLEEVVSASSAGKGS